MRSDLRHLPRKRRTAQSAMTVYVARRGEVSRSKGRVGKRECHRFQPSKNPGRSSTAPAGSFMKGVYGSDSVQYIAPRQTGSVPGVYSIVVIVWIEGDSIPQDRPNNKRTDGFIRFQIYCGVLSFEFVKRIIAGRRCSTGRREEGIAGVMRDLSSRRPANASWETSQYCIVTRLTLHWRRPRGSSSPQHIVTVAPLRAAAAAVSTGSSFCNPLWKNRRSNRARAHSWRCSTVWKERAPVSFQLQFGSTTTKVAAVPAAVTPRVGGMRR